MNKTTPFFEEIIMKNIFVRALVFSAALIFSLGSIGTTALASGVTDTAQNITINKETFEDDNFRAWLQDPANAKGIGADGVLTPEELESITWLAIQFKQIRSLKGIEYFTNLTFLDVEGNYLERVDLSSLTKLKSVYLRTNLLTSIDFSHNTELEFIEIFDNRLTSIDVSMLPNLKFLHVDYNQLKELDLSANKKLEDDGFVLNNNLPIEKLTLPVIRDENGEYKTWDSFVISEQDEMEGHATLTWYKDKNYTEEVIPNTPQPFDGSTYYARRNPNAYTIFFDGGSGVSGSIPSIKTYWNETVILPGAENLTRKGYTFDEWLLANGVRKSPYDEVMNLSGKYSSSTKTTISALWAPIQYQIHVKDEKSGTEKTLSATYDKAVTLPDAPNPIEGLLFAGWELPDQTLFAPGASVKNLTTESDAIVNLEGRWVVDELGILKKELIQNVENAVFAILSSPDYYQGAKEKASELQLQTDAIESAEDTRKAQARYQEVTDSLSNLPKITDTNMQIEKAITDSKKVPTALTDLVTLDDAHTAEAVASTWSDDRIRETVSSMVSEGLKDHFVTYTAEDKSAIVDWLCESSALIEREREHTALLKEAAQLIKENDSLMSTASKDVTPDQIPDYEFLLSKIDASPTVSILTSYRQSASERLNLARAKAEALVSEARQTAVNTLKSRFSAAYKQKDYSSANWNTMNRLLAEAAAKLSAAVSVEAIDTENVWTSLNAQLSGIAKITASKPAASANSSTQTAVTKPKSTSLLKLTAAKKGFTAKWKKQSGTTGYQIQYSTSKKFSKGTKTTTIKKSSTVSKKISKLKAKKKYYVRVRTYKTAKINGKTKTLYSGWSKVKTVKTKK